MPLGVEESPLSLPDRAARPARASRFEFSREVAAARPHVARQGGATSTFTLPRRNGRRACGSSARSRGRYVTWNSLATCSSAPRVVVGLQRDSPASIGAASGLRRVVFELPGCERRVQCPARASGAPRSPRLRRYSGPTGRPRVSTKWTTTFARAACARMVWKTSRAGSRMKPSRKQDHCFTSSDRFQVLERGEQRAQRLVEATALQRVDFLGPGQGHRVTMQRPALTRSARASSLRRCEASPRFDHVRLAADREHPAAVHALVRRPWSPKRCDAHRTPSASCVSWVSRLAVTPANDTRESALAA